MNLALSLRRLRRRRRRQEEEEGGGLERSSLPFIPLVDLAPSPSSSGPSLRVGTGEGQREGEESRWELIDVSDYVMTTV